jgi:hypothetical protein
VPVLARAFEAAGMSTVTITMMPIWCERIGVPRTLAVEFPFGHPIGHAHDVGEQLVVVRAALDVLRTATEPGTIVHLDRQWPDAEHWRKAWQPKEPSPIIKMLRRSS